jgi:carbon monoxide dehydrogenase subunit G
VKVKIGPVAMSFKGVVKFTERDEQGRLVRLVGEGREAGGGGSAKLTMLSKITPVAEGGSQVVVEAEMDVVGKIVQFGRGMMEEVSRQMFRQFSACVRQQLEIADASQDARETRTTDGRGTSANPEAVSALPLALRALWAIVVRSIKRLFGKPAN